MGKENIAQVRPGLAARCSASERLTYHAVSAWQTDLACSPNLHGSQQCITGFLSSMQIQGGHI